MTATSARQQPTTAADRSTRDRSRTILASAAILGMIALCAVTANLYRLTVPAQLDRDTINITRSDYEQALTKWKERGVAEYTVVLMRKIDTITLRVNRQTGEIFLLQWLRGNEPYEGASPDPNTAVPPGLYYDWSVDGMFETVGTWLAAMESGQPLIPPVEQTDNYSDFVARFDPELGYPTYLGNFIRSAHKAREVVWRSPAEPPLQVVSLTIMR